MDIQQQINDSFNKILAEGKIEAIIEKKLEDTLESVLKDILGSWSPLSKQIKTTLEANLQVNLDSLPFEAYNDTVLKVVKQQIDGQFSGVIAKELKENLEGLFAKYPDTVALSKIIEDFKETIEGDSCRCSNSGEITVILDTDSYDKDDEYSSYRLYLDENPDREKYLCDYSVWVYKGKVHSVSVREEKAADKLFLGPFYGFERFLFYAYVKKLNVTLDVTSSQVESLKYLRELD